MGKYQENIIGQTQALGSMWMRRLQITFTSKLDPFLSVAIGDNGGTSDFNITVSGRKYEGTLQDGGSITVYNMEQDTLALIIAAKLYKVEIKFGYKSDANLITFAKGEIAYISQTPHARHDTVTHITYAAEAIAAGMQNRINFSANSGVNIWTVMNGLCNNNLRAPVNLQKYVLSELQMQSGKAGNIVESVAAGNDMLVNVDSSIDKLVAVSSLDESRVIRLAPDFISIQNGNPTVTADGLSITVFPVFNFIPGDIIQLDNGILDLSQNTNDYSAAQHTFNSMYIDVNGQYYIRKIDYTFQNRGETASLRISARAVSLMRGLKYGS